MANRHASGAIVSRTNGTTVVSVGTVIAVTLEHVRLWNPLNGSHGHWSQRAKRAKEQRNIARMALTPKVSALKVWQTCDVTITRVAPGTLDNDNLAASAKHVRDGVADALGIDDSDPWVRWRYAQLRGKRGEWAVRIELQEAP